MLCSSSSARCKWNQTFGCTYPVPSDSCAPPKRSVWTSGPCKGLFDVGDRKIGCGLRSQCWVDDPIVHAPPPRPLNKSTTCLVLFACSRDRAYQTSRNGLPDQRFATLNEVYRDRIPRWLRFGFPTFSIDSCTSASSQRGGLVLPGVTPLNFNGSTAHCVWGCPTVREKIALAYAERHLPSRCDFVFKITGKYFAPTFENEFKYVPGDTELVVQYDTFKVSQGSRFLSQRSEIYGIRRGLISELLRESGGDAERQLASFARKRCDRVHRMNRMGLNNFTMRSDWRTMTSLR